MLKLKIIIISLTMIIVAGIPIDNAQALDNGCKAGNVSELTAYNNYILRPYSGVIITAEKTGPNNVVVIGQDPKAEGVSIQVMITSVPGQITFDTLEKEAYCDGPYHTYYRDPNKSTCSESKPGDYYYWSTRDVCVRHTQFPVYRRVRDARIWLKPSPDTSKWLGGIPVLSDGRYGLHYIYPDQWMVGMFTGNGVNTQGTYTGMNGGYYQNWLSQMQGFNFLAGSGETSSPFLSNVLTSVPDPIGDGTSSLGLYGNFSINPIANINAPQVSPISIECSAMYFRATTLYSNEKIALNCPFTVDYPTNIYPPTETISMNNIPLDVPGLWYIGVEVQMLPASFSFEGNTITENPLWISTGPDNSFWFGPNTSDTNYLIDNNYFNSYIILTSPCNFQEIKGCWDGSK